MNSYYGSFAKIIPNRSGGYHRTENGYENAQFMSMHIPFSAGSLLSTVDDLQKWNDALFSGKVVSNVSLKKMTTPFTLSNNVSTDYGYGLGVIEKNGKKLIGHAGGIGGFQTYMGSIPDLNLLVIVLTNIDNPIIQPSIIADKIFEIAVQ